MQRFGRKTFAWLLLAAMVVWMTGAQLLFKGAALHALKHPGLSEGFVWNAAMWLGLVASAMSMACWLGSLRELPLSRAYPWTALIYIFTPLASVVIFDESLGQRYYVGMAILVIGIFLSAGGVRTK